MTYFWKEWRDHRAIVIGMAIAAPVVLALCAWALPDEIVDHHVFPPVASLSCYLVALLSIGSDLLPGEARRNRLGFLRRLPADLTAAFVAKVVFLGVALAAFTAYGYQLACWFGETPTKVKKELEFFTSLAYCAAPWVLAISAWLPRGALAVPAAGLALALFGLPFYLIVTNSFGRIVTHDAVTTFACVLAGWSVVVAWVSWARGRRLGRGIASAAWRGALASLVLFVPAWGYTGYAAAEWQKIDPYAADFRIHSGILSANGKRAYLNCRRIGGPNHVLAVDLETGAWERVGGIDDTVTWVPPFRSVAMGERYAKRRGPVAAVLKRGTLERQPGQQRFFRYWVDYIDTDTGERIRSGWQGVGHPEIRARLDWHELPEGAVAHNVVDDMVLVATKAGTAIYDPFRRKLFRRARYRLCRDFKVRPGRWLVRTPRSRDWFLLDPETGERTPSKLPSDGRFLRIQMLPDGRVLYTDRERSRILVADPETGRKVALPIGGLVYTEGGGLMRRLKGRAFVWARLDLKTHEVTDFATLHTDARPIASFDDKSLLAIEPDNKLVRAYADRTEIIFPK